MAASPDRREARPPLRVVIDGRRLAAERTGVGRYLEVLLAAWAGSEPAGFEVVVALHDPMGRHRVPVAPGLRAEIVAPWLPGLAWERFGLGRLLRPGDVLFAPTNLVPAGWPGPTVLVLFDALMEARPGDFPRSARLRFRGRYRRAARRADRVLVPSRAVEAEIREFYGVPAERLRVVYPAVDPAFRPLAADSAEVRQARRAVGLDDAPYWLFLGKRSRRRHVLEVREAFRLFRGDHPAHRLVFAGPAGPARIDDPGVIEPGHVPDAILPALLAGAEGLLYPSEMEGFGLPVAEALAAGCPAITLRRGALIEAGGEAAVYLDRADPRELLEAMRRLAIDPAWRAERVAKGLEHAARFRPEGFAAGVAAALREVAGAGRVG